MEHLPARQWIPRCSAVLQQQWRTVSPDLLDELANDLWADVELRHLDPERAAFEWLTKGIPVTAIEASSGS